MLATGSAAATPPDAPAARSTPSPKVVSTADELADVLAQREKNLRTRADLSRKRYANGLADGCTALRAERELLFFLRDRAATLEEKIRLQEQIVLNLAEVTAVFFAQCSGGTGDTLAWMDAREQELAARQQLLEWKLPRASSREQLPSGEAPER